MKLTPAMRKALEKLRDESKKDQPKWPDDYPLDEICCDGDECYIGLKRVSKKTVNSLLRLMAISAVQDGDKVCAIYVINETGRNILNDESQINVIQEMLRKGGAWTWKEGKLVEM